MEGEFSDRELFVLAKVQDVIEVSIHLDTGLRSSLGSHESLHSCYCSVAVSFHVRDPSLELVHFTNEFQRFLRN